MTRKDPIWVGKLSPQEDRALGAFYGLFVGDALGAPVEFQHAPLPEPVTGFRAGGWLNLPAGMWTDDGAMALALAQSIVQCGGLTVDGALTRFLGYMNYGAYHPLARCIDIGYQTRYALSQSTLWQLSSPGGVAPPAPAGMSAGNGSIMRLAPVATALWRRGRAAVVRAATLQGGITHPDPQPQQCCALLGSVLQELIASEHSAAFADYRWTNGGNELRPTGYCWNTLHCAMLAVKDTGSFEEAVLCAVNLGGDADTIGAVTGQLAGAKYGYSSIPQSLRGIAWRDEILEVGRGLLALGRG